MASYTSLSRTAQDDVFDPYNIPTTNKSSSTDVGKEKQKTLVVASQRSCWNGHLALRVACGLLHLGLVFMHIILIGIWKGHLEHRVTVPLGEESRRASTAIVAILQTFGTLYSAGMLLTVQLLTAKSLVRQRTTLTAVHDANAAWSGFGGALLTLYRQISLPSRVSTVLVATLYLGGLALVHISTPSLFALETFNITTPTPFQTSGLRDFGFTDESASEVFSVYLTYKNPAQSVSLLKSLNDGSTPGLSLANSLVYSIPPANNGTGPTNVTATYFNVTCGTVPNVNVSLVIPEEVSDSDVETDGQTISGDFPGYQVKDLYPTYDDTETFIGNIYLLSPNALVTNAPVTGHWIKPNYHDLYFVANGLTPIVDSSGKADGLIPLDPPLNYSGAFIDLNEIGRQVTALQVIGCSLSLTPTTAIIDAQSLTVGLVDAQTIKESSTWSEFPHLGASTNHSYTDPEGVILRNWVWLMSSTTTEVPAAYDTAYSKARELTKRNMFSNTDLFFMQDLGLTPDVGDQDIFSRVANGTNPQVTLHALENSISSFIAGAVWSDVYVKFNDIELSYGDGGFGQLPDFDAAFSTISQTTAVAFIDVHSQASRLTLSLAAVIVGLVASILLLILSIPVISGSRHDTEIDGLGGLQVVWLTPAHAHESIATVSPPTTDNLRSAGMIPIEGRVY